MKKMLPLLLVSLLLAGCGPKSQPEISVPKAEATFPTFPASQQGNPQYVSPLGDPTIITLDDNGILVDRLDSGADEDAVMVTHDIIYYEDRDTYDSGNPYGEGEPEERHSAEEAAAHMVVNITKPGAYLVQGKLSAGQIRVDLGKDAYEDETAVVDLILCNADITCTVAPAILFQNVYECDGNWSEEDARPDVDTSAAGANLILEGQNIVNGSHVAKIFKDKDGEKKLWKQDGAIYSYMSMNVEGPGSLELNADNEGMDTELHLTINGGNIHIYSGNDGINTNEDGVSVTTINDGNLTIFAGLGKEGDGIDSNGYLVINGGTVISCAKPVSDAGLDSDLGSFVHGGTVIAMGSAMDWAESDSRQVTMNLQFAGQQKAGSKVTVTREDGTEVFSFENNGQYAREFRGLILSHPAFTQGETYQVYVDGQQMAYTGTDVARGPGGFGGHPGEMPENFDPNTMPEGFQPDRMPGFDSENMPEDFDPSKMEGRGPRPEGMMPPESFDGQMPEGMEPSEGFDPGQLPGSQQAQAGEPQTGFYMNDKVNAFSGVAAAK